MNNKQWIDLAASACEDAGIQQNSIDIITTWEQTFPHNPQLFRNNAVFRLSENRILKIYWTDAPKHFAIENAVLQSLDNQLPSPRFIAGGSLENSLPYIIMSEIAGKTLQECWADLTASDLLTVAREIGVITAQLHQQSQEKLAAVEAQYGDRFALFKEQEAERIAEIEANTQFSRRHKDELLDFLHGEARDLIAVPPVLSHADFSWGHVFITEDKPPIVSGFIDWGEAMLMSPEVDIAFHWLWTFSQDRDTMRECLNTYYQDKARPERLARRCFASHFYTYSMGEVWDDFTETVDDSDSIVRAMVKAFFPEEVFGSPN
jgi:Ser/Thr protein kinase RdoA (MazF antagonist)